MCAWLPHDDTKFREKKSNHFHYIPTIILKTSSTQLSTVSTNLQVFEVSSNLEMCIEVFLSYLSVSEVWGFWGFHEYGDLNCGYDTVRLGNYQIFLKNLLASSGEKMAPACTFHSGGPTYQIIRLGNTKPHRQNSPCTSEIYKISLSWDNSFLSSVKLKSFPI